jgi:SSS family solute:Na+ symporter
MPLFMARVIPTGLLGLLTAGMLAAYMSTQDSYLLAFASVITQDVVAPLRKEGLSDKARIVITQASIVAIGAFLIVWGLWYPLSKTLWDYMAATGTVYLSGASAAVAAGLYWKRASRAGAILALLGGLVSIFSVVPKEYLPLWLASSRIGEWYSDKNVAVATWVLCAALMVVGSLVWPDKADSDSLQPVKQV